MKLIGISGTNGSGKDTIGHILADSYGFMFISITDILREDLIKHNLPANRLNMRQLSAQWRRESGLGTLIDRAIQIYNSKSNKYVGLAIASLRNPGEADRIHELGGTVLWVDGDPVKRYARIQKNVQNRGQIRAVDDRKSFDQFLADEKAEMQHSGDAATLSMGDVKKRADVILENNGDDVEKLNKQIARALKLADTDVIN